MELYNFRTVRDNNWTKIQANVSWHKSHKSVFFAVPSEYESLLSSDYADCFLIGLMLLAIKHDENIYIRGCSVSPTLISNLEQILFPTLNEMGCGLKKISIICDKASEDQVRGADGATGISLGIDSFYAILENYKKILNPVSVVLFIQQLCGTEIILNDRIEKTFKIRKSVADRMNLKFIPICTNLREIVDSEFVFSQYHTFCHLAAALSLTNINCYYYATGFSAREMKLCFSDTAYYDNIISEAVALPTFQMKTAGAEVDRLKKTDIVSHNSIVQNYLDVCLHETPEKTRFTNCSKCHKCNRTLTTLEVIGMLPKFGKSFDLEYYNKNRYRAWGDIEYRRLIMKDEFSIEIYKEAKAKGIKLPNRRWFVVIFIGIKNQICKLKRIKKWR